MFRALPLDAIKAMAIVPQISGVNDTVPPAASSPAMTYVNRTITEILSLVNSAYAANRDRCPVCAMGRIEFRIA